MHLYKVEVIKTKNLQIGGEIMDSEHKRKLLGEINSLSLGMVNHIAIYADDYANRSLLNHANKLCRALIRYLNCFD